jgi:hypothetical protein
MEGSRIRSLKVILFKSYFNVLLPFMPLSIIYRILNGESSSSITLFCLASFNTIPLVHLMQLSLHYMRWLGHITDGSGQIVFMKLAFCFIDVLVGVPPYWYLMLTIARLEFLLFYTTTRKFFVTSLLACLYVIFFS